MKNKFFRRVIICLLLTLPTVSFTQETETETETKSTTPLYQLFHMYMEYGSGEFSNPYGERLFEQIDVKMTYIQNIPKVEWLSLGFIGQVTWDAFTKKVNSDRINNTTAKALIPSTAKLSATVGFLNNIFTIGVSTDGMISGTIFYNKVLPKMPGLYSHDFTFLFSPGFYTPGNQYSNGVLKQGWFDKLEMRVAYRMKFNQYIGLRPEFLFNFTGTDLLAGKSSKCSFMFRFNPRMQVYFDQFSMFIEPRFFYIGNKGYQLATKADNGFIWEIKVGFDITHLIFKD